MCIIYLGIFQIHTQERSKKALPAHYALFRHRKSLNLITAGWNELRKKHAPTANTLNEFPTCQDICDAFKDNHIHSFSADATPTEHRCYSVFPKRQNYSRKHIKLLYFMLFILERI